MTMVKVADQQVRMKKHLIHTLITMLVSLGGVITILGFIRFGPQLQDEAIDFTMFLLVVFGILFFVSLYMFIVPLLNLFVFTKIFPETVDPVDRFLMEAPVNHIEWDAGSQQFIAWSKLCLSSDWANPGALLDISECGKTASEAALKCMERQLEILTSDQHSWEDISIDDFGFLSKDKQKDA